MKLVADTNIVFSLFKSDSFTRKLLMEFNIELFAPRELLEELNKYSKLICIKSGISKEKFLEDLKLIPKLIELRETSVFFEDKASKLISHISDIPLLALALESNIPVWSNDPHLKEQCDVKVFTTEELKDFFET